MLYEYLWIVHCVLHQINLMTFLSLICQLAASYFIMKDFKGHHPLWAGKSINEKVKLLKASFLSKEYIGSTICLYPGIASHPEINLAITESSLQLECILTRLR